MHLNLVITLFIDLLFAIGFIFSYFPQARYENTFIMRLANELSEENKLPMDVPKFVTQVDYQIFLSSPERVWIGDNASVFLKIDPIINHNFDESKNMDGSYQVFLEGRFDWDLGELLSGRIVIEPLFPTKSAVFFWQFEPVYPGARNGEVWLFLNIQSIKSGVTWQQTRLVIPIEIEVSRLLGLSIIEVRGISCIGLGICSLIGLFLFAAAKKRR